MSAYDLAYSSDGINWTTSSILSATQSWYYVCFGGTTFVAVGGFADVAAYSSNGTSWTQSTMPTSATWVGVAYGGGRFVAIAYNTNACAYSTDGGATWTAATMPSSQDWASITYNGTYFVAFAGLAAANTVAAYSTNGTSWTQITVPSAQYFGAGYGVGKTIGLGYLNPPIYSTTGTSFSTGSSVGIGARYQLATDGTGLVTPGYYSSDGINWSTPTFPSTVFPRAIAFGGGVFSAVSEVASTNVAYSSSGTLWTVASTGPSDAQGTSWVSMAYGASIFVAVGSGATPPTASPILMMPSF